eukprot:736277_1
MTATLLKATKSSKKVNTPWSALVKTHKSTGTQVTRTRDLSVASWNLKNYGQTGNGQNDADKLQIIRKLASGVYGDYDIIVFQEVVSPLNFKTQAFADLKQPFIHNYQAFVHQEYNGHCTVVLIRKTFRPIQVTFPINIRHLCPNYSQSQRLVGVRMTVVLTAEYAQTVLVLATHLPHRGHPPRLQQAARNCIQTFLAIEPPSTVTKIIVGDMNTPDSIPFMTRQNRVQIGYPNDPEIDQIYSNQPVTKTITNFEPLRRGVCDHVLLSATVQITMPTTIRHSGTSTAMQSHTSGVSQHAHNTNHNTGVQLANDPRIPQQHVQPAHNAGVPQQHNTATQQSGTMVGQHQTVTQSESGQAGKNSMAFHEMYGNYYDAQSAHTGSQWELLIEPYNYNNGHEQGTQLLICILLFVFCSLIAAACGLCGCLVCFIGYDASKKQSEVDYEPVICP